MFRRLGLFNQTGAGSPSFDWDEHILFEIEKQYGEIDDDLRCYVLPQNCGHRGVTK
jgi:hypothetical protein